MAGFGAGGFGQPAVQSIVGVAGHHGAAVLDLHEPVPGVPLQGGLIRRDTWRFGQGAHVAHRVVDRPDFAET